MEWNELISLCKQNASKISDTKERAKKLKYIEELEGFINIHYPECIDNPDAFIAVIQYHPFLHSLNETFPNSRKPHFLLNVYREIAFLLNQNNRRNLITTKKNAEFDLFDPDMVSNCFATWLKIKGWSDIKIDSKLSNEAMQVWAELKHPEISFIVPKHIERLYAKPIGTIIKGVRINGEIIVDRSGLRAKIGTALIHLIDKMNEDKHLLGCLLIAKDPETHNYFKPYCTILEKTGIKIFWVKSATEVEEN